MPTVSDGSTTTTGPAIGIRHLQATLLFLCTAIAYFIRVNASVAVVAMTNKNTTNPDFDEFDWNETERNYILGAFYCGYILTQIPGGWLAQRYGAKFFLFTSLTVSSILSLITPFAVRQGGWLTFCGIRIVQGVFQGTIYPCLFVVLSKWSPFNERNTLATFCNAGTEFGTTLAFGTSGFIAASPLGWPGISYISGGIGIAWAFAWLFLGASTPAESKIISSSERKMIETSLNDNCQSNEKHLKTPWLPIFSSIPFRALIIVRTAHGWGFTILLMQIPTYFNKILKMDIESNAIFSAIPYALMMTVSLTVICIANFLTKHNVNLSLIRKSINTIAFWVPAVGIIALGYIPTEHSTLIVALLVLTVGCNGANTLGSLLNHIDLSPNYAGVLMGITNTSGNIVAIILPLVQSAIVTNDQDQDQWRIMFILTSGIFFFGNLIFIIYGRTDAQPWNNPIEKNCNNVNDYDKDITNHDV